MAEMGNIQWFPGHMTKTRRMIQSNLSLVDGVVEILDARVPESSRNPEMDRLVKDKPRMFILNKADMADDNATAKWINHYKSKGFTVIKCNCKNGDGIKGFLPAVRNQLLKELMDKRRAKGIEGAPLRLMIVGIPNVGKSSFINRMAKSKKAKVEDRPGVTRTKQWVKLGDNVEMLDMPGVLWPKFEDQVAAMRLAATGAIAGEIFDSFEVVSFLLKDLAVCAPDILNEKYGIQDMQADPLLMVEQIGRRRGSLLSGGVVDTVRAQQAVLSDFRSGKLGTITLDGIPEAE